jgi:hypothetical protein|tara:strand:+ start:5030 stop:5212 length:183 start_codon:yes stop_codon:yes gene_type:complete
MPKKWWELIHIRPQVLTAIIILGIIALVAIYQQYPEIAGVAGAGIIALSKDVITSDSNGS